MRFTSGNDPKYGEYLAQRDAYSSHNLLHNDVNIVFICLKVNKPNDENAIPLWNSDGTPLSDAP
jgi:hypothetical protein